MMSTSPKTMAVMLGCGLGLLGATFGIGKAQASGQEIAVVGQEPVRAAQSQASPKALESKESTASGDLLLVGNEPIPDLATGVIDNRRLYNTFVERGEKLIGDDRILDDKEMLALLERAPKRIDRTLPNAAAVAPEALYERMMQASLLIGTLYDCGRCNHLHANISGGVVITADGLAVTNYHVLARTEGKVKGLIAMNYRGECFAIADVLAASQANDVAVVRLATDRAMEPVPLAERSPRPMSPVMVLSHPHNEFFVLTTGVASRIAKGTTTGDGTPWLEITAEFSGGSSGSGVFNDRGELVGLVSRIHPMFRAERPTNAARSASRAVGAEGVQSFPEQILRRCVPMESMRSLLN